MSLMRVYPNLTVDGEFDKLGELGFSGALNDRQYSALVAAGYSGALPDMMKSFFEAGGVYPEGEPIPGGTISPASITVQEGEAFSQQFTASGGTGPYTWSIQSGTLPGGLTLAGDTISGTPTGTEGDAYSFTIRATDSTDDYVDQAISGTVQPSGLSTRWRMNITAVTGTSLAAAIYDLQLRSVSGGSDLTSPAEAVARSSASSSVGAGFTSDYGFNDTTSDRWQSGSWSGGPEWIEWEFAAPVTIVEIAWYAAASNTAPEDFSIQYYNGSTWETYWSETGQVSSASYQISTYPG